MADTDSYERQLQQAKRTLQQGDLPGAQQQLSSLLEAKPAHREALYYSAVCYRKQRLVAEAEATLGKLIEHHPDYGRAYQERAYCRQALNDRAGAVQAFEQAVTLNPALQASWLALFEHYGTAGDQQSAARAQQHLQWLAQLPPALRTVTSLIHEQKYYVAEQLCREFLDKNRDHPEAMRLLAQIGSKLQILDDAETLLYHCLKFAPEFARARLDYVQVLHKRQKFQAALEQAEILHAQEPGNQAYRIALASEQQAVGDFGAALASYDTLLQQNKPLPAIHVARGHALKTIGRTQESIKAYRQAYSVDPNHGDAYWSLANLKTYQFTAAEIETMRDALASEASADNERAFISFALGKAYEDRGEYANAFEFYSQGNALKQGQSRYDPQRLETEFDSQKALFDADFFAQRQHWGCPSDAPIFIVGLPRAGSTLLEQILASHSAVDGTMELANVIGLAHRLQGRQKQQYPAVLTTLKNEHFTRFGEEFIKDTQYHRQGGRFFIDKMPNNFRHIALIHLMLPNAKIIDARRQPMACCFSGYKQLFAEGQEFSYSLESIGRYYRAYVDLMAHWEQALPGRILRVQHEDVIDDLEGQVCRLLDFCGLPFEQQCVDFHQTERAVRTPSSEQVRQPIYRSGQEQWQNFEPFLEPLKQALGPALESFR